MELFKLLGTIAISGVETAKKDIDSVSGQAGKLGETLTNIGNKASDFGGKLTTRLSVPLTALGTLCVKSAADVKAANSQFEQTFGDLQDTATKAINNVANASGILETRLQGVGTSIYAFAKSSGADSAEAMALMEEALQATADAAAYYDRSLDETSESLMSFLKGNFANDAALGVSCTETTRNAKAMELFGQKYNDLSEIQKQQTLLKMVTDAQKLSGAMGQASRESDGFENVMGNLKESAKLLSAEFGEVLLPTVVELMQAATKLLQSFNNMDEGTKKLILTLAGIAIAVGPVLSVVGKLATGIGTFVNIASKVVLALVNLKEGFVLAKAGMTALAAQASPLGAALAGISAPVAIAVGAIVALIAIGVALYKNWDEIKAKAIELWNNLKETFGQIKGFIIVVWEAIKIEIDNKLADIRNKMQQAWNNIKTTVSNAINGVKQSISTGLNSAKTTVSSILDNIRTKFSSIFENARSTVKSAIDKIRSYFNFTWSLPKLKLPHFNISGKFSLDPPSVPKFSVEWYKKAMDEPMIMNSPTAFGINAKGQIMAGGEAGSEVVSGTETLMNMIGTVVAAQNEELNNTVSNLFAFLQECLPGMSNIQLVMDSGAVIGELAPGIDKALGKIAYRNGRGV